jgi:predicted RNA-binding protein with RPS1 domain
MPLDRDISTKLGRPIRIENDANCFALSEAVDGAAAQARVVFGVILGTGVGGGIVVDKQVITGRNKIAGEWGHSQLPWMADREPTKATCYCGKAGCIETFLSGAGLSREYTTVTDILRELEKPGRDPRPSFKAAVFKEGVETLSDIAPGLILEGVVTNVAAFGAFVDIGVHQDGLVHVSAMAKTFVKDPRSIVKPGDIVRVKVLDVDKARKRIALTLRLDDEVGHNPGRAGTAVARADDPRTPSPRRNETTSGGALADALRRAGVAAD